MVSDSNLSDADPWGIPLEEPQQQTESDLESAPEQVSIEEPVDDAPAEASPEGSDVDHNPEDLSWDSGPVTLPPTSDAQIVETPTLEPDPIDPHTEALIDQTSDLVDVEFDSGAALIEDDEDDLLFGDVDAADIAAVTEALEASPEPAPASESSEEPPADEPEDAAPHLEPDPGPVDEPIAEPPALEGMIETAMASPPVAESEDERTIEPPKRSGFGLSRMLAAAQSVFSETASEGEPAEAAEEDLPEELPSWAVGSDDAEGDEILESFGSFALDEGEPAVAEAPAFDIPDPDTPAEPQTPEEAVEDIAGGEGLDVETAETEIPIEDMIDEPTESQVDEPISSGLVEELEESLSIGDDADVEPPTIEPQDEPTHDGNESTFEDEPAIVEEAPAEDFADALAQLGSVDDEIEIDPTTVTHEVEPVTVINAPTEIFEVDELPVESASPERDEPTDMSSSVDALGETLDDLVQAAASDGETADEAPEPTGAETEVDWTDRSSPFDLTADSPIIEFDAPDSESADATPADIGEVAEADVSEPAESWPGLVDEPTDIASPFGAPLGDDIDEPPFIDMGGAADAEVEPTPEPGGVVRGGDTEAGDEGEVLAEDLSPIEAEWGESDDAPTEDAIDVPISTLPTPSVYQELEDLPPTVEESAFALSTEGDVAWGARWDESAQGWIETEDGKTAWRPIITTGATVAGWKIETYLGVVTGDAVISGDVEAADLVAARDDAVAAATKSAMERGAHSIVGVQFTVVSVGDTAIVTACGTAVTLTSL